MVEILLYGLLSALAVFILILKVGIRRVVAFDLVVDISFTVFLAYLLAGSFAGMMSALIGGLALSIALWVSKQVLGYQKPIVTRHGIKWRDA